MNSLGDIFRAFCKFVDERIFPEENAGTYVAFVVDQAFVEEFCKLHSLTEKTLMDAVGDCLYDQIRDISFVKGMLAIQLFAASKMAESDGFSARNYRYRLSKIYWIGTFHRWMNGWERTKINYGNHFMIGVTRIISRLPNVK